jgi:hypothetical protein
MDADVRKVVVHQLESAALAIMQDESSSGEHAAYCALMAIELAASIVSEKPRLTTSPGAFESEAYGEDLFSVDGA